MSGGEERRPRIRDPSAPATENQRRYLVEHGVDPAAANDQRLTKGQASTWIDGIMEHGTEFRPGPEIAPAPVPPEAVQRPPGEVSRALAPEAGEIPGFVTGREAASALLVYPEVGIDQAKRVWQSFKEFKRFILEDPECFDDIEGSREMNRTGATRLAIPFGLSIEERAVEEKEFAGEGGSRDVRFIVRVRVSKGQRFVDGVGSARLSEIPETTREKRTRDGKVIPPKPVPLGQREHFAYTRAFTRADKRAIADLLGGTEAE